MSVNRAVKRAVDTITDVIADTPTVTAIEPYYSTDEQRIDVHLARGNGRAAAMTLLMSLDASGIDAPPPPMASLVSAYVGAIKVTVHYDYRAGARS